MKKWMVLLAGVVLQSILGGIYAWSEFVPSLTTVYGLSRGECGLIFGTMISTFTLTMIPAGRFLHTHGPRLTAGIGAILFAAGYLCASASKGEFIILLIGIGIVTGSGIGFGYVCPLTVGMKWFPKNKGLVTGISVAGFGGGAILLSAVAEYLLESRGWDVLDVFRIVGLCFGSIALISAMFISIPEKTGQPQSLRSTDSITPYLASKSFLLICLGMFAGTFAGLMTVGNLKPMTLGLGLSELHATWSISVFAFGNAIGRILWGQVHDRFGSRKTILLSLVFLALTMLPFVLIPCTLIVFSSAFLCGIGFGACFVVYASAIVEKFGADRFVRLYPVCFLGYGLAGFISPGLGGWIADITGSYLVAIGLSVLMIFCAIGMVYCLMRRG